MGIVKSGASGLIGLLTKIRAAIMWRLLVLGTEMRRHLGS